ncbi:MAG TPA: c-type cytochrome domain-containing protein [Gemmataceae bacterium]|nr:c-type cytochrome domain-containing protein [Gemmataceae bacterium]
MLRSHRCFCVLCAVLAGAVALAVLLAAPQAARAQAAKGPLSFINDVAPILKENCFACHDAKKRKGKLDMTTYETLRKGGDHDDPVVPGKPDESYAIDLLNATDASRMPPKDSGEALPKEKIALIEQWVKEGAKLDAGLTPKSDLLRELRVRWKPPQPPAVYSRPVTVAALAFTPDSKQVVVGGQYELTVWDAVSGKLEKRLAMRPERAMALTFLPDGKLALAGGRPGQEGNVAIYDLNAKGKVENGVTLLDGVNDKTVLVKELLDTDDVVYCLAVSADGKKLAAGNSADRTVNVWDLSPGYAAAKLEQSIENHADWVLGIAFSPDAKQLLTCGRDKTAKVWDLAAKESLLTFPDHQNTVWGVAAKPDGKLAYSVGEDGQLRTWNATGEGKQVRAAGSGGPTFKVVLHPKLPLMATCGADKTVRLWNPDSGATLKTLSGHADYVYAVALSPDGNLVASGGYGGEVKVWKVADGSNVKSFNAAVGLPLPAAPAPK